MKLIIVVDHDEGRRVGLATLIQPWDEMVEGANLQEAERRAAGREIRALFIAWEPSAGNSLRSVQKTELSPDYVVPVLLLPRNWEPERVQSEANEAGTWCKKVFPQAKLKFVDRLAGQAFKVVMSEILEKPVCDSPAIVGSSREFLNLLKVVSKVARNDHPVLISGEPGSGKETIARLIHSCSSRGGGPFEVFHLCPGIDTILAASELCGHVKGAFSWAVNSRQGRLEDANAGTLYIPEIMDLQAPVQLEVVKLLKDPLRAFQRVGSDVSQRVDVRVIIGTRQTPEQFREGSISPDLMNHLRIRLRVPPLKRRGEDITLLAKHFLQEAGATVDLDGQATAALQKYPWPDNLDELDQAMKDAMLQLDQEPRISLRHLPAYIQHAINRFD